MAHVTRIAPAAASIFGLCLGLFAAAPAHAETSAPDEAARQALQAVAAGAHRNAENKARDIYRHPIDTLLFFGIRPQMSVVEIYPGGGWYAEILAPFLKDSGTYYAAGYDADSNVPFFRKSARDLKEKFAANPELYGKAKVTELAPPAKTAIAPAGSADLVLTFRNVHNWMAAGNADEVFAAMYAALKPGGVLGVVEHRANADKPQDPEAKNGYVREDYVIALAEKAGFKFSTKSEVNANPKDTKDYPKGVWTLPPTFAAGDSDRAQYAAIGESDRMTLKFIKP